MTDNPLSSTFDKPELTDEQRKKPRFRHLLDSQVRHTDHYFSVTELSLREIIDMWRNSLSDCYSELVLPDTMNIKSSQDWDDARTQDFHNEYSNSLMAIEKGASPTELEEQLRTSLFDNMHGDVKKLYPQAFVWLVCADLLEQKGLKDKAWPALLEFAFLDSSLSLAYESEFKHKRSLLAKKYGSMAYGQYANLHEYLIEFLETKAPKHGWESQKLTAKTLTHDIWERHQKSEHRQVYDISKVEVETKIYSWLRNESETLKVYYQYAKP